MASASDPDQFAAWQPHVGDLVRIREGVGGQLACDELPHYWEEQGHTGKLVRVSSPHGAPGHPYLIQFDRPVPYVRIVRSLVPLAARHYRADELEFIGPSQSTAGRPP